MSCYFVSFILKWRKELEIHFIEYQELVSEFFTDPYWDMPLTYTYITSTVRHFYTLANSPFKYIHTVFVIVYTHTNVHFNSKNHASTHVQYLN